MKDFSPLQDYEGLLARIALARKEAADKPFYYIYRLQELQQMITDPKNLFERNFKQLWVGDELRFDDMRWKIIDCTFTISKETDLDFMKYGMSTRSAGQQYPFNFELILIVEPII